MRLKKIISGFAAFALSAGLMSQTAFADGKKYTAKDALAVVKAVAAGKTEKSMDANGDGKVSVADALFMLREATGGSGNVDEFQSCRSVKVYDSSGKKIGDTELYFFDGVSDIPYFEIEFAAGDIGELLLERSGIEYDENTKLPCSGAWDANAAKKIYTVKNENGGYAEVDFDKNTIFINDYPLFTACPSAVTPLDRTTTFIKDDNGDPLVLVAAEKNRYRHGGSTLINFDDYGIKLRYEDGKGYIPLATYSDIFMSRIGLHVIHNSKMMAYIMNSGSLGSYPDYTKLGKIYFSEKKNTRSRELIKFNYGELCLALDLNYGLKQEHGIDDFDTFFRETGLYEKLMSSSAEDETMALMELIYVYFDDYHSNYGKRTPFSDFIDLNLDSVVNRHFEKMSEQDGLFAEARAKYYKNGVPAYEEVGDTAFITFDGFSLPYDRGLSYYTEAPDADADDTLGIISYANARVNRENSPIKKVVLDLSMNGGGTIDAAVFTIAAFLGEAEVCSYDPISNSSSLITYYADVNFDGKYDEKDTFGDRELYCLVSGVSFSCGNYVPAAFSMSDKVTLVGQTTGGGACEVLEIATADSTIISISGSARLSVVKNGTFYSVDNGIIPDAPLTKLDSFYDRKKLAKYLDELM